MAAAPARGRFLARGVGRASPSGREGQVLVEAAMLARRLRALARAYARELARAGLGDPGELADLGTELAQLAASAERARAGLEGAARAGLAAGAGPGVPGGGLAAARGLLALLPGALVGLSDNLGLALGEVVSSRAAPLRVVQGTLRPLSGAAVALGSRVEVLWAEAGLAAGVALSSAENGAAGPGGEG